MAIYNITHVNNYMKIAGSKDVCTVCAKKLCQEEKINAGDAIDKLRGKLENQKVLYLRTSGQDQCVCLNCIKDIYDEHVVPTLTNDNKGDK